jgi:hypothetical protein
MGGHTDDIGFWKLIPDCLHQLESIHFRHFDIRDQYAEGLVLQNLQSLFPTSGSNRLMANQMDNFRNHIPNGFLIIHD